MCFQVIPRISPSTMGNSLDVEAPRVKSLFYRGRNEPWVGKSLSQHHNRTSIGEITSIRWLTYCSHS